MTAPDPTQWIGARKAARILGVHENTVRNWAADGTLQSRVIPGRSGFRRYDLADVERLRLAALPSYHDLHITTDGIPRTSIFDLPYGIQVQCNRVAGWEAWDTSSGNRLAWKILGGEFNRDPETGKGGLRLDVAGHVICDSLTPPATAVSTEAGR